MAIDFLGHVREDAGEISAAARRGGLDAPVESCPGWSLGRLAGHLGWVHRWATVAATTGDKPGDDAVERPPRGPEVVEWFAAGVGPLLAALAHPVPGGWTFLDAPNDDAGFWPRRQAVETAIHRWDVQQTVATGEPVSAEVAVAGIDEMLAVVAPARLGDRGKDVDGSLHLHCTDVDGEWTVRIEDGVLVVDRGHAKGDAAMRGPASTLLLALWGRRGPGAGELEVFGDESGAERWLTVI